MENQVAQSQAIPILLNLLAAVIGASGQYLYKIGGLRLSAVPFVRNWPIYTGMICFCLVMTLFVTSYRLGGRLSVTYPVYATTFVWGTLIGIWLDREPFVPIQLMGVAVILVGVGMVASAGLR